MGDIALKIENVSKMYKLGVISTGTLSHDLNRWYHRVRGLEDPYQKIAEANIQEQHGESGYVWALKDVSFDVKQGEAIGIIGKNGAGKSTLLKILSRVTSLTKGEIKINGRIASLLEVGTGFHPELTGRENIFLNGAILGMKKHEIRSKLNEIIAFSGVERYVDTPVKRYSSGMRVRLAFAVAAHLEPEILVVDEVLAVGDAEFQKKAIGKMQDVSQNQGRTVLFVSHNMGAVKSLCGKGLIMKNGFASPIMTAEEAVNRYLEESSSEDLINEFEIDKNLDIRNYKIFIEKAQCFGSNGSKVYKCGDDLVFDIQYRSKGSFFGDLHLGIYDGYGTKISHLSFSYTTGDAIHFNEAGRIVCKIESLPLVPGRYSVNLSLTLGGSPHHRVRNAFVFQVEPGDFFKNGKMPSFDQAKFLINSEWVAE